MPLLALSLFFTEAVPLEMPRAEAYFVRDGGSVRLEDRYDAGDLWTSRTVDGRWIDEADRVFLTATFGERPPETDEEGRYAVQTRAEYLEDRAAAARRPSSDPERELRETVLRLSPIEPAAEARKLDHPPKGVKEVLYWQGTNTAAIVCTYRARRRSGERVEPDWKFACWSLAEGDDFEERSERFDEEYLRKTVVEQLAAEAEAEKKQAKSKPKKSAAAEPSERELLRADAHHAVAAYENWHVTDSDEFIVLDDLERGRGAVTTLTNEFKVMRAKYAATVPTGIDGSNVLAVARLFASRDEYLDALAADGLTNLSWTAAYWSQSRRELVAYLPDGGVENLLGTVRHEAFHQYLAYAASMIAVSPWLNEGYAQFFEGDGYVTDDDALWNDETVELGATLLPALLAMDYEAFYSGTDRERQFKYRLAESLAVFLERGAPKVRFAPFADLKKNYFRALFETKKMNDATSAALGSREKLKLLVAEWRKYMKNGRFQKDS